MTQHEAVATSLCAIVPTGLAATYHNARRGAVNFRVAGMIGGASMIAAGAILHPKRWSIHLKRWSIHLKR